MVRAPSSLLGIRSTEKGTFVAILPPLHHARHLRDDDRVTHDLSCILASDPSVGHMVSHLASTYRHTWVCVVKGGTTSHRRHRKLCGSAFGDVQCHTFKRDFNCSCRAWKFVCCYSVESGVDRESGSPREAVRPSRVGTVRERIDQ